MNYKKRFRLAYLSTRRINDSHEIVICDETKDNYGGYYAAEEEFDTEEEAIEHAMTSEDWKYRSNFVVLPFYEKTLK